MPEHLPIDLRSDTVTRPGKAMREAMAAANVGDDVYREDPTVNRLEERAAEIFGKEAGLFVPTGTMGNTIAIKLHTKHGEEVVCDSRSHIVDWELSMMAWFAGCLARTVQTKDGLLTWPAIETALRAKGPHNAPTALISLENTHNMSGGNVYDFAAIDSICSHAHERGLKVHIDGARIFNAAAASGVPVSRIAEQADTVMFCLSKGLGAPVGSILVGRDDAIAEGRLLRKRLGGGMRQVGVLAAPGLLALQEGPARLQQDHENARWLAEKLAAIEGILIDPAQVRTNIIIFDVAALHLTAKQFSDLLKERGILANGIGGTRIRMLTHLDVSRRDCEVAMEAISAIASSALQPSLR